MDTLKELIAALGDPQYALDLNTPVCVAIYGVAQKQVVRIEKIIEPSGPKIVLYLEEYAITERDEKIRAIGG